MIVGHTKHVSDLIKLVARGRLSHGYIFWGPERVGKRTVAHAFGNFLENGTFEKIREGGILKDYPQTTLADYNAAHPIDKAILGQARARLTAAIGREHQWP